MSEPSSSWRVLSSFVKFVLLPNLTLKFPSEMTPNDLEAIPHPFYFPLRFQIIQVAPGKRVCELVGQQVGVYVKVVELGLRFPLHPFLITILNRWGWPYVRSAPIL